MKEFSVNKTSWHYRLNVWMAKTNERLAQDYYAEKFVQSKDNLCSYWRMTSWSVIKVAFALISMLVVAFVFLYLFYGIGYAFLFHTEQAIITSVLLFCIIAFVVAAIFILNLVEKRKKQKIDAILYNDETETSLTKAKYSSWKNGICLPVEFK